MTAAPGPAPVRAGLAWVSSAWTFVQGSPVALMHTGFMLKPCGAPSAAGEAAPAMAARPVQTKPGHEVDLLLAAELLDPQPRASVLPAPTGLQVCPACTLPFVVPGQIHQVLGHDRVRIDLECTNCSWETTADHTDAALTDLDIAMDRSFADLLWTLEVVWIANEELAIDRFASALAADAIVPDDF